MFILRTNLTNTITSTRQNPHISQNISPQKLLLDVSLNHSGFLWKPFCQFIFFSFQVLVYALDTNQGIAIFQLSYHLNFIFDLTIVKPTIP